MVKILAILGVPQEAILNRVVIHNQVVLQDIHSPVVHQEDIHNQGMVNR